MLTTFDAGEGRTLSYLRRGSGPLVVCVPGGPGMDPEAYYGPLEIPGHEMLILAPRGTGASTSPPSADGYRIAGYVDDVESLRRHLGLETMTLYGHSHGGSVVLAYASAHPSRVERLVLITAPPRIDEAFMAAVQDAQRRFAETVPDAPARLEAARVAGQALDSELPEDEKRRHFRTFMARYVARQGPAETAYLDRLCSAPMNWDASEVMFAEMFDGLDLLEHAGQVTAPALVIAGEFDVVVPPAAVRLIADALPAGRYVEFPGVGHFPEVEAAAEFRTAVRAFVAP